MTAQGLPQARGLALEAYVDALLGQFREVGDIVQEYHLLVGRSYPDFWVKDAREREWLLECKNIVPGKTPNPKFFSDNGRWVEKYLWTESHILSKAWKLPRYETKHEPGKKKGVWVEVKNPLPVLIIRHCNFDMESLKALDGLFHDPKAPSRPRIITFGEKDPGIARYPYIHERLRELFTRGLRS